MPTGSVECKLVVLDKLEAIDVLGSKRKSIPKSKKWVSLIKTKTSYF